MGRRITNFPSSGPRVQTKRFHGHVKILISSFNYLVLFLESQNLLDSQITKGTSTWNPRVKNIYSGTFCTLNTLSTFYYTKLGATTEFRAIEGKHMKISQRLCCTRQITIAPLEMTCKQVALYSVVLKPPSQSIFIFMSVSKYVQCHFC